MNQKACFFLLILTLQLFLLSCGKEISTGKREARGVWMSRFEYTNEKLRNNPEAAKAHIRDVFQKARKARFNMLFFQVRGNGTSFYQSAHEPWALELTGSLVRTPPGIRLSSPSMRVVMDNVSSIIVVTGRNVTSVLDADIS